MRSEIRDLSPFLLALDVTLVNTLLKMPMHCNVVIFLSFEHEKRFMSEKNDVLLYNIGVHAGIFFMVMFH